MEGLLALPAIAPPPGHTADLEHPPSQAYLISTTVGICLTVATLMVWMRMYVGLFVAKPFRWDDGLLFVSWLCFIAYCVTSCVATAHGATVDVWNLRIGTIMKLAPLGTAIEIEYCIEIMMIKLSVLLLHLRCFMPARSQKTWLARALKFLVVFNGIFYVANIFVLAFRCTPRPKIWNPLLAGKCISIYSVIIGSAATNVVSTFFMVVIPPMVICGLNMSRKRKTELSFVFAFGLSCFVCSIGRLVTSIRAATDPNRTIALVRVGLWSFGEIGTCFLACCVPMVPIFIRHIRLKRSGSRSHQSKAQNLPRKVAHFSCKEPGVSSNRHYVKTMHKDWAGAGGPFVLWSSHSPVALQNRTGTDIEFHASSIVDISHVPKSYDGYI